MITIDEIYIFYLSQGILLNVIYKGYKKNER